jgi:hypothetical protein
MTHHDLPPEPTGREAFERFRGRVLADRALREALLGESDPSAFVDLVVRLGHERGDVFTAQDVEDAFRAGRRAWFERWV